MRLKSFLLILSFLFLPLLYSYATQTDSSGNRILWEQNFPGLVYDCAFMPDENYIIDAHDTLLEVRKTEDQSLVRSVAMKEGVITTLDVSKDGKYVVIGGGSLLKLLDINTFEVIKDYHKGTTNSVSLSPDGKKLAFAGIRAYVIDVETGNEIFSYGIDTVPYQFMNTIKFTPNGKFLVCDYMGGSDPRIFVFDTDSFKLYCTFNNDEVLPPDRGAPGYDFIFSPNSQYIMVNGANQIPIRTWDITTKQEITPKNNVISASALVFFHDNETIYQNVYPFGSWLYNIKSQNVIDTFNFTPPISKGKLNSSETLLLGPGCLVQLDISFLSVNQNQINSVETLLIPNPTNGFIQIKTNIPYDANALVEIYNDTGNFIGIIKKDYATKGELNLQYDASSLAQGVYFIKIQQKDFSTTLKLIKEK